MNKADLWPAPISSEYARYLRMSKAQLADCSHGADELLQTGAAYIGDEFVVPNIEYSDENDGAAIETFVVDATGECTATGQNDRLIVELLPTAKRMAQLVLASLAEHGVVLDGDSFLTGSVTVEDQVTTTPHFDDELFVASDGVGIVAIAANLAGPRIACSALRVSPVRESLPVGLDQQTIDDFDSGLITTQQSAANRIVVFPQFGQLHCGPTIEHSMPGSTRTMFVLRAGTRPS
ncbi:MAG: hypothetical protein V3V01_18050 [Acidimicrobiales bacterium]